MRRGGPRRYGRGEPALGASRLGRPGRPPLGLTARPHESDPLLTGLTGSSQRRLLSYLVWTTRTPPPTLAHARASRGLDTPAERRAPSTLPLWLTGGLVAANVLLIVWLWWNGGNVTEVNSTGDLLVSIARLTGLLGAFSALLQVLLLARIPWVERAVGFDRLTVWHRWNGHACLDLVLAHVVFSVWGYAVLDRLPLTEEISTMIWGGVYPGMITATIGTALLVAVVVSSIVVVRRHVRYEAWYAIHLTVYLAIALAWFHQIPTGNELVLDRLAADYWRGLYLATLALLLGYRVLVPVVNAFRFRMRVVEVVDEGAGAVSLRIGGRRLDRLHAKAGQFFLWRFLTRDRLVGVAPVLALGRARRPLAAHHDQGAR